MTYKPEIDGLRAIAVLAVLLCHMQLGMTGGYIGVDIFFVISGYLITSIILNGVAENKFSFLNFYGRRFVRLYPALFCVAAATFIVGYLLADPNSFKNLARTGKYALWSISNLFYNKHQGYFDIGADQQMFLHTWSLGVEWQFYILWPLIAWVTLRFFSKRVFTWLLLIITLGSLAASQYMVTEAPNNAYYLMPFRAFELGLGGLLVLFYQRQQSALVSATLVLAGSAVILFCAYTYTAYTPFPGLAALWPCLGAVACIYGGQGFQKGNFLRFSSLVYIGKISYSVYLVHWPLLLFYRYYVFRPLVSTEKIALVLTSLVLGALLYHSVEQKINWRRLKSKKIGVGLMFAVLLLLTATYEYTSKKQGLPARISDVTPAYSSDFVDGGTFGHGKHDRFGDPNGELIAYLAGDSFAAHLRWGTEQTLIPEQKYLQVYYSFGCFIGPEYEQFGSASKFRAPCVELYQQAIEAVNRDRKPLLLAQDWLLYLLHVSYGDGFHFKTEEEYLAFIEHHLARVKKDIGDNRLVLIGMPNYYKNSFNIADCIWRPTYLPQVCQKQAYAPYQADSVAIGRINQALKTFAEQYDNTYFIDVTPSICPDGICHIEQDMIVFNDGRHYSRYGSELAAETIWPQIKPLLNPEP